MEACFSPARRRTEPLGKEGEGGLGKGGGRRRGGRGGERVLPDGRRTRTTARASAASVARVKWALSCLGETAWERLLRSLFEEAAGPKDFKALKWLRDNG